ncbi:shikimate dehydrogenase [Desulfobacula toluolica]|uniref:Shikimate dehydrogenase (NADP(+)) n=1 Tax=Desulfobacula toluolica (strain DSM 7467 / Tol2) TaxID=651182 RepID=K0NGS6_DESTT|nr:shikimate dehydrogenase [Desulfobacula toluolica]CCK80155.1 AroE: shikimate dehydrogenase [Desulfobacula toluolica Tol2]
MIDSKTKLYCIFGKPVTHSKSPLIHNACFQKHHMNSVYLAFEIDEISDGVKAMRTLNIKGASVTIPFKESIMKYLDEIDEEALSIGAVNTVVNRNGKLIGYNTDYKAAVSPLRPFCIMNKKVCIIGAGGAAQAVAYGIHKEKGKLVIINRNKERGKKLASKYNAEFISMDKMNQTEINKDAINKTGIINADIIINTTSIGMSPDIETCAFPSTLLDSRMIVMDIVYTPLKTKLLSIAQSKGCTTIDGLSMFLHQGAAQFKLWTDILPDIKLMRQTIIKENN